jgi:hypothetical protein
MQKRASSVRSSQPTALDDSTLEGMDTSFVMPGKGYVNTVRNRKLANQSPYNISKISFERTSHNYNSTARSVELSEHVPMTKRLIRTASNFALNDSNRGLYTPEKIQKKKVLLKKSGSVKGIEEIRSSMRIDRINKPFGNIMIDDQSKYNNTKITIVPDEDTCSKTSLEVLEELK